MTKHLLSPVSCLFFYVCVLASCGGKRDIRDYYYPLAEFRKGQVYEYDLVQADTSAPEYWYFRSFLRDSGQFMAATYYDRFFQIGQIVREKIVDNGSLARDYFLYEPDTVTGQARQIRAQLDAANVFPFQVQDSLGVFLFSLKYRPLSDTGAQVYLIRNRRFLGEAPDFEFKGKKYACIRFGLREVIGNDREGSLEIEGRGEEWYARGLGLVYYRKTYGSENQLRLEYRLKDVFPMAELERRAGKHFGVE